MPIVSCLNTIAYDLSAFLALNILLQVSRTSQRKTQLTSLPSSPVKRPRTTRSWCLSRKIAVYQRTYRGHRTSRAKETGKRRRPGWQHDANTSSDCGPLGFLISWDLCTSSTTDRFANNETSQTYWALYPVSLLLLISTWRYLKNKR